MYGGGVGGVNKNKSRTELWTAWIDYVGLCQPMMVSIQFNRIGFETWDFGLPWVRFSSL